MREGENIKLKLEFIKAWPCIPQYNTILDTACCCHYNQYTKPICLTLFQTTNFRPFRQILDSSELKEFAEDNFKFYENDSSYRNR